MDFKHLLRRERSSRLDLASNRGQAIHERMVAFALFMIECLGGSPSGCVSAPPASQERRHRFREAAEEGSAVEMFHVGLEYDEPDDFRAHAPESGTENASCSFPNERLPFWHLL